MSEAKQEVNVDEILDGTLDDLADIPEWKPYPAGGHRVVMTFERVAGKPQIRVKMKAIETVELANATDTPLQPGAEGSIICQLDNEFGQGTFKMIMGAFKTHLGMPDSAKNSEIMQQAQGMECVVITTIRENSKDKSQKFIKIEAVDFV